MNLIGHGFYTVHFLSLPSQSGFTVNHQFIFPRHSCTYLFKFYLPASVYNAWISHQGETFRKDSAAPKESPPPLHLTQIKSNILGSLFSDDCYMSMVDADFEYTYEYQGNAPKLVHTPLNDKCYLTLTQGMKMGLGGNPYGPAGTGKTESVKALGGLFGRQVLVFNCDEVGCL